MSNSLLRVNKPLHQFERLELRHIIDELVECGADRSVLSLLGNAGKAVAAVVILRGDHTEHYLISLDKSTDVSPCDINTDQVLDICSAYESGCGCLNQAFPNPHPRGTPEHAAYAFGKQKALKRRSS